MAGDSFVVRCFVRRGAYHDSIVLLQLQVGLAALDGVLEAGAVMAAPENLELLREQGLLPEDLELVAAEDLLVAVRAESETRASDALARIDELLERPAGEGSGDIAPRSLSGALRRLPEARWTLVSVPGRYAAQVAREALELGRHVFLFSDNVAEADEIELKALAAQRGLLVLGPDCGTARIGGVGLGFANRLRPGPVGLVGASGTGLQAISTLLDRAGVGVNAMIGTGGHDLSAAVGGTTTLQALDLLARDPECRVITVVSKPPAPDVARQIAAAAIDTGKPVVLCLIGHSAPARSLGNLWFATGLGDAAALAIELSRDSVAPAAPPVRAGASHSGVLRGSDPGLVRGLFSGGTLALEGLLVLRELIPAVHSNLAVSGVDRLEPPYTSRGHTLLDLGDDHFTRGRPHPMIDSEARIARLAQEAADPEVGLILLDVVLGDGASADPAAKLAPAIRRAIATRTQSLVGRPLEIHALLISSEDDPQEPESQAEALRDAGATLFRDPSELWDELASRLCLPVQLSQPQVPLGALQAPLSAINVGLASFAASLEAQGASVLHVDWRPPAGGDERLMSILNKLKAS